MTNIAPIRPGIVTCEREVNPEVVSTLEDILTQARAGEIIGFTGGILYFDGTAGRARAGKVSYGSIGALATSIQAATDELLNGGK